MDRNSCRRLTLKIESLCHSDALRDPDGRTRQEIPCAAMNDTQPRRHSTNLALLVPDKPLAHPASAVDVTGFQARCRTRIQTQRAVCVEPNFGTSRALRIPCWCWSGRRDSNSRPPVPKTGALPDCATPRLGRLNTAKNFPLAIRLCQSLRSTLPARVQRVLRKPWVRQWRTRHDQPAKLDCMPGIKLA